MSGVLVVAESRQGEERPITAELLGAAARLSAEGAGPVKVLPASKRFEAHVAERALEQAIERERPALVLAGHTIDSMGFAAAVAARRGLGFSADVVAIEWNDGAPRARRQTHGGKLVAEVEFPGKETAIVLLRPGAFEAAAAGDPAPVELEADLTAPTRSEHLEFVAPPAGDVDIAKADFLLSIGRGVEEEEDVATFAALAERMGATLSASRPLVDAGWLPNARQVGQSGRTVAPKVYLAMGISGAVQHLAGIGRAETVIAINSDPEAPIFAAAEYGAVADMFAVAEALERRLQ